VRTLKCYTVAALVELRPADLFLQIGGENPEHLPIDVIDRGREEQQRADRPAEVADACADAGGRHGLAQGAHEAPSLRWWGCAGESRTRESRAAPPPSAAPHRP